MVSNIHHGAGGAILRPVKELDAGYIRYLSSSGQADRVPSRGQ